MLRVEFKDAVDAIVVRIQGAFLARAAQNARDLVSRCQVRTRLIVDISEVTVVDRVGEQVLSWLGQLGAKYVASTPYGMRLCRRLKLPVLRQCAALQLHAV